MLFVLLVYLLLCSPNIVQKVIFFLTVLYENYAVPMHKYSAVGLEGHFLIYLFVFLKLSVLRYDLHV